MVNRAGTCHLCGNAQCSPCSFSCLCWCFSCSIRCSRRTLRAKKGVGIIANLEQGRRGLFFVAAFNHKAAEFFCHLTEALIAVVPLGRQFVYEDDAIVCPAKLHEAYLSGIGT